MKDIQSKNLKVILELLFFEQGLTMQYIKLQVSS